MPRNRDDNDDGYGAETGRRLTRAREPRPADTSEKSVLLRRHRAAPTVAPEPQPERQTQSYPEPAYDPRIEQHDPGDDYYAPGSDHHAHITGTTSYSEHDVERGPEPDWPPEPPPIDFQDLDHIRDELDHEMPPIEDELPAYAPVQPIAAVPEPVTGPTATTRGSKSTRSGKPQRANREQQLPDALTPIVPQQSVAGRALMLVVGIMCFLACLAVGALVLVEDAAQAWQLDVSREVTVQVKPVDGKPMEPMLQTAMDLARSTEGVRNVRLMSERESAGLLEPWLGAGFDYTKLPIPRLIVIELTDPATANLKGLAIKLAAQVPSAALDDHSIWAKRLRTMAGTMVAASVVVLVLVLTAMVLSVIFATRAAMAGNRDVVQVLHFVGAEDSFIAGEFQHHFLILGFKGGVGGGIGAMLAFLVAGWVTADGGSSEAHALFGGFSVGLNGYLGAAGIVFLVAGLTALTSRLTVRSYLNQLD